MKTELPNENASQEPEKCNENIPNDPSNQVINDTLKLEVKEEVDCEVCEQSNGPDDMFEHEAKIFTAATSYSGMQNNNACYDTTALKSRLKDAPFYEEAVEPSYSTVAQSLPVVNNLENNVKETAMAESCKVHEELLKLLTPEVELDTGLTLPISSTSTDGNSRESYELIGKGRQRKVSESNPDNSDVDLYWEMKKNKFLCKLCTKIFLEIERCRIHIRSHLGLKPFACTHCTKVFASKIYVRTHIKAVHINCDKYKCEICNRTYNRQSRLTIHVKEHNGDVMPFDCAECGKTFTNKNSILKHIVNIHNGVKTKNLCEVCGKVFHNLDSLVSHRRVHKEKRLKCEKCNKSFMFPGKLSNHMASHSKELTFICDVCSKTFRSKATLGRHVTMYHRGKIKVFKCTKCEKSFRSRDFWKEHLLKHEGIRKYSCETCGKTFAQNSHLAAHKFSHGEKKFVCPLCGAKFNRNDNMKSHVKRHETKK